MAKFQFGKWPIAQTEVFATSQLSYALVNFKPIQSCAVVSGHVLVSSRRVVKRFAELSPEEVTDIWLMAQKVGRVVEREYKCTSLSFALQDGEAAGQTVAHVHIHVIPRINGDFKNNDDIYPAIERCEKDLSDRHTVQQSDQVPLKVDNDERVQRTKEDMAIEAKKLRPFFTQYEQLDD